MFERLQNDIGHGFSQVKLLENALTHSSYANEEEGRREHNERLEFLGDAVLELCVSRKLYQMFPEAREGRLTAMRSKLVSKPSLAGIARRIKLEDCLLLGKGEESQGGRVRDSLLSDAFEAILGAVFLDGGFAVACEVVERLFAASWPEEDEQPRGKDCKSLLQELTQKHYQARPEYHLSGSSGPEHAKIFAVRLVLPDGREYTSEGPSVKRAEQLVASLALADFSKF